MIAKPLSKLHQNHVKYVWTPECDVAFNTLVVELSRQMSSCKDLVVEPSQLGSLKGLSGTRNTRFILVRPLTVKVKAYVQLRWY